MNEQKVAFSRLSFIPHVLAVSAGMTWYVHGIFLEKINELSFWTYVWGPGLEQLEPRKWASWTMSGLVFLMAFEMFRRFDWFFQPIPGETNSPPDEKEAQHGDVRSKDDQGRSEERQRQRKERKRRQEERKLERDRKREEEKAQREKDREQALREKAERAASARAQKVREAAEQAIREEDREVELKHGKALGLQGKLTPEEIKKKYRELMTQYHPDKVRGMGDEIRDVAERKAKEINEAYDYFRKKYDL